jgi:hypothetical protein
MPPARQILCFAKEFLTLRMQQAGYKPACGEY